MTNDDFRLTNLAAIVLGIVAARGYVLLDGFADRYGAWEATYLKSLDGLDRYLVIAVVEDGAKVEVSVMAGAEKDGRTNRTLLGPLVFPEPVAPAAWPPASVQTLISSGLQLADSIQMFQLTERTAA
jgi:hypothetical protein